jgi:hypothetical protein
MGAAMRGCARVWRAVRGGTPVLGGDRPIRMRTSRQDFRATGVVGIGTWFKCESGGMRPHLVDSGTCTGRYDRGSRTYIEGIVAVSTGTDNIDYSS